MGNAMQLGGSALMFGASMLLSAFMPHPKLKPQKVASAAFDSMIKITHGNIETAAEVLWQTDLIPGEKTAGKGGGGGGTIITYHASYMLSFGEVAMGKTKKIRQIWANGVLVYDGRPGAEKVKKYKKPIRFYDGSEAQLPDPDMEAAIGVGLVPAYRGLVCVFLKNFPLEDYNNANPNFTAEVVEEETPNKTVNLIDGFAQGLSFSNALMLDPRDDKPFAYATQRGTIPQGTANSSLLTKINTLTNEIEYEMPALDSNAANGISSDIDNDGNIYSQINAGPGYVGLGRFDSASGTLTGTATNAGDLWRGIPGNIIVDRVSDSGWIAHVSSTSIFRESGTLTLFDQEGLHVKSVTPNSAFGIYGGGSGRRLTDVAFDKDGNIYCLVNDDGTVQICKSDGSLFADLSSYFTFRITSPDLLLWFAQDNSLILGGHGELVKFSLDDMAFVKHLDVSGATAGFRTFHNPKMQDTIWLPDVVLDSGVTVPGGSQPYFPAFQEINLATLSKKRFEVFREAAQIYPIPGYSYFAPIGAQYDPTQDVIWSEAFPELAIAKFSLRGGAACVTLRSVVEAFSARVGLVADVDIDASLLDGDVVCGYVIDQRKTSRAMLEPLLDAHAVDVVDTNGKITFIPRGSGSIMTIPQDDLASHEAHEQRPHGGLIEVRKEEMELPAELNMIFFDEISYEQGHEKAMRIARNVKTVAQIQLEYPEVFSRLRARGIVERKMGEMWLGRTVYEFQLQPKYLRLNPTDVVTPIVGLTEFPLRLTQVDVGANFLLKCKGVAVDLANYEPPPADAGMVVQPPAGGIPADSPTVMMLIDSPMLRESDNDAGFNVAMAPELGADAIWKGGIAFKSTDNAVYNELIQDTTAATMGYAITALPTVDRFTSWDKDAKVRIKLYNGAFESITQSQQLQGNANTLWFATGEVAQFGTATPVGDAADNVWDLSGPWVRALGGTEDRRDKHAVGEKVVLLQASDLRHVFQPASEIGVNRWYKGVSYGDTIEDSTVQQFTDTARALKPLSPMAITGARDGSNNLTIDWIRRSRFSGSWNPLTAPVLGEASEQYRVQILDGETVLRTMSTTTPTATYSAANQTTDGITPGAPVTVSIAQLSAVVGAGITREATL